MNGDTLPIASRYVTFSKTFTLAPRYSFILRVREPLWVPGVTDEAFNIDTALQAASVLSDVLARRRHRKTIMGQECLVPGQLGDALGLPRIIHQLQSRNQKSRELGLARFEEVWRSLSERSRRKVRDELGWWDPKELDWDDPRSNRRPV